MPELPVQVETRITFWGIALTRCREELGLSETEFAAKCGWTQQNQAKLELPGIKHTLDFVKRAKFRKLGIRLSSQP